VDSRTSGEKGSLLKNLPLNPNAGRRRYVRTETVDIFNLLRNHNERFRSFIVMVTKQRQRNMGKNVPLAFDSSFPYTCLLLTNTFLKNEKHDDLFIDISLIKHYRQMCDIMFEIETRRFLP